MAGDAVTLHIDGPDGARAVRISSPTRVLWPESGITKLELAEYLVARGAPVDVFVYGDARTFRSAMGPGTRENVGGQAHPAIRTLFGLIEPSQVGSDWVDELVRHELTHIVLDDVTGGLAAEGLVAIRGVITSAVGSLMWFSFALIAVALVVAGLAIVVERRDDISAIDARPGGARAWLRSHARDIGWVGIGVVAFVALWNVGGPDITLITAAVVGIILIAVSVLAGRDEPEAPEPARPGG